MDLVRAMLAMLPALWLVASGHRVLDQADQGIVGRHLSSISFGEQSKHALLDNALHPDSVARRLNRRLGTQSDVGGSLPLVISSVPPPQTPQTLATGLTAPVGPLDLAGCWQFYWRTALAPRAPSFIS